MPRISTSFPDLFLSSTELVDAIYKARQRGEISKIGPRLYTRLVHQPAAQVIRQRRWQIAALYAPGAVIGYRTALESQPTAAGTVFASGAGRKTIDLDGLHLRVMPGAGPLEGDTPFIDGLHLASRPRAVLESLRQSRRRPGKLQSEPHNVPRAEIERYLDRLLETSGEDALNAFRDLARRIAPDLRAEGELELVNRIVGALLGSRSTAVAAPYHSARGASPPFDANRLVLFETLRIALSAPMPQRPDTAAIGASFTNAAFLDAYFSNFIEGTEFEIDEARDIVFNGRISALRPADSHDVLGTFELVGDRAFMHGSIREIGSGEAFVDRIRDAHRRIMAWRPETSPGTLKEMANRAGSSQFVAPELVRGTLVQGLALARSLDNAFSRALAIMFIVSEVHPFADGNGRVSRALMNAELVAGGLSRIVIPTVFREDYLGGLRSLTRSGHTAPFIKAMDYAQRVTNWVTYDTLDGAIAMFEQCHAFDDESAGTRLRLPAVG